MKILTIVLSIVIYTNRFGVNAFSSKVSPSLVAALGARSGGRAWDLVVEMNGGVTSILEAHSSLSTQSLSREEKASQLSQALLSHATTSQQDVLNLLSTQSTRQNDGAITISSSWISNVIFVHVRNDSKDGVNMIQLISSLVQASGVSSVREQVVIKLEPLLESGQNEIFANGWNIEKIGAPAFWDDTNARGSGVLVGHIDSGVRYTHVVLRSNWVGGREGWHDPRTNRSTPFDSSSHSHGTHTLATAVGSEGIGVAPLANWTSCLGCYGDSCPESDLTACGQFMICPSGVSQTRNCTGVPHLVTNSWGSSTGGQTFYDSVISAWRSVGIIPIFAAGNDGPDCRTLGSPGDNPQVLAVGATSINDSLAYFSSVGPSTRGSIKPDIVAPGVQIRSAIALSDTNFGELSGTSMSTPHVAGAVALLLSDNNSYSYDQVRQILIDRAQRKGISDNFSSCGGNSSTYPNHKLGYGRLSLANIVEDPETPTTTTTTNPTTTPRNSGNNVRAGYMLPLTFAVGIITLVLINLL